MADEKQPSVPADALETPAPEPPLPERAVEGNDAPAPEAAAAAEGIGFAGQKGTAAINVDGVAPAAGVDAPAAATAPEVGETAETPAGGDAPVARPQPAAPLAASSATRLFKALSYGGPVALLLLLALQTAAGVLLPSVYAPQELALIAPYEATRAGKVFWVTGAHFPGYYWLMAVLHQCCGVPDALLLPVMGAVSAGVALCGAYVLALSVGLGNGVAFAAGVVLLSSVGFVFLSHCVAPALLFGGLLALAMAALGRALNRSKSAWCSFALAGVLSGLCFCTGGVLALWVLLVGALCLVCWRGTLGRINRPDAVLGFGLFVLTLALWLLAATLWAEDSNDALQALLGQCIAPFMPPYWPPHDPWWQPLLVLAVALVPWVLVPLFVNWFRVLGNSFTTLKASRRENAGLAWLWICLVLGLGLCLLASHKPLAAELALLPLLAVVLAKALLRLSAGASQAMLFFLAFVAIVAGIGAALAGTPYTQPYMRDFLPAEIMDVVKHLPGLPVLGTVLLLAGLVLFKLTDRRQPAGALLVVALLATVLAQAGSFIVASGMQERFGAPHAYGRGLYVIKGNTLVPQKPAVPAAAKPEAPKPEAPAVETPKPEVPAAAKPEAPKPEVPAETRPETPKVL